MGQGRNIEVAEKNGGYTWIENRFIDTILPQLSGESPKIYLLLARKVRQDDAFFSITPPNFSQAKVGRILGLSRESVNRGIKRLENLVTLKTIRETGQCNRYLLLGIVNPGEPRCLTLVKKEGFTWIANTCIDKSLLKLSGTDIKVYIYVARYVHGNSRDQKTRKPLPQAETAKGIGLHSRSIVIESLHKLEKLDLIEAVTEPGYANYYRLLETCEENSTGDVKETLQGSNENPTPPVNESLQINSANRCEVSARDTPKSTSKNKKRNLKKRRGKLVSLKTALEEYVASWGENDS